MHYLAMNNAYVRHVCMYVNNRCSVIIYASRNNKKQYVSIPTRKNSTIDLCYGNIPHAYKSYPLPPIGNSDHDTVKLVPLYRPKIRTACIIKKTKSKSGHLKISTN